MYAIFYASTDIFNWEVFTMVFSVAIYENYKRWELFPWLSFGPQAIAGHITHKYLYCAGFGN